MLITVIHFHLTLTVILLLKMQFLKFIIFISLLVCFCGCNEVKDNKFSTVNKTSSLTYNDWRIIKLIVIYRHFIKQFKC